MGNEESILASSAHSAMHHARRIVTKDLHEAAREGDLDRVKYLVTIVRAKVNKVDDNGCTALHFAAQAGHLPVIKYLIRQGKAEVHNVDEYGETALRKAADNDHLEVCRFLISSGASVNAADVQKCTPLHMAARRGRLEVVKLLTSEGAEVNKGDKANMTALHHAAALGNLNVIQYLINQGAEVDKTNIYGKTALYCASDVKEPPICQGAEANVNDRKRMTASFRASDDKHRAVIKYLIKQGAEMTEEIEEMLSSRFGRFEIIQMKKDGAHAFRSKSRGARAMQSQSDLDTELKLENIAEHLPPEKYTKLCNMLGISYNKAKSILTDSGMKHQIAVRECLADWMTRTGGSLDDLKDILIKAELRDLLKYLGHSTDPK